MNLGFTPEHESLREVLRRLLLSAERRGAAAAAGEPVDGPLWRLLAEGGWLATAVPEAQGGSGLGDAALCMLAEEAGRALAAVPLVASACAFVYALHGLTGGPPALPWAGLVAGSARGLLLLDDDWSSAPQLLPGGRLQGVARQVPDGPCATHVLLLAGPADDAALVLATLAPGCRAEPSPQPLDPLHPCCDIQLSGAAAQVLARGSEAQALWVRANDAHALFVAFEQLGGAQAALEAARAYSLQRYAFGRPVGSFQALKHLMADMLVAIDLARSNCLYGLAALAVGGAALGEAAAVARISATEAFRLCAAGSTQVHGAIGITWEADCHLFYRRAQALAGSPGSQWHWKDRLVRLLQQRAAPVVDMSASLP